MKESRRHRWVPLGIIPEGAEPEDSSHALCRDCGLEVKRDRVKAGGLGDCPGKMIEQQYGLSLLSGDPQSLSVVKDNLMACAGCGKSPHVMIAHRNPEGEITGWVFSCGQCFPALIDHDVIIRPREKGESHGEEGQAEGAADGDSTSGRPAGTEGSTAGGPASV